MTIFIYNDLLNGIIFGNKIFIRNGDILHFSFIFIIIKC